MERGRCNNSNGIVQTREGDDVVNLLGKIIQKKYLDNSWKFCIFVFKKKVRE